MPERTVNPKDSVDLILGLSSLGGTLGTLYPRASVYDNNNVEITGSPFALSKISDNLYVNSNAFQAANSGTYKVVYLIYTDDAFAVRSNEHQEVIDIINVKIQSTTGLGGYGSMKNQGNDVIVDFDIVKKWLDEIEKKFNKRLKRLQKDFDAGLKIDVKTPPMPSLDLSPIKDEVSSVKTLISSIKSSLDPTKNNKVLLSAIKKNRTTIIRNSFDKAMLKPMLESVANTNYNLNTGLNETRKSFVKVLDSNNVKISRVVDKHMRRNNGEMMKVMDGLNESVRTKLKYLLEEIIRALFSGRGLKQNINIAIKKDE